MPRYIMKYGLIIDTKTKRALDTRKLCKILNKADKLDCMPQEFVKKQLLPHKKRKQPGRMKNSISH